MISYAPLISAIVTILVTGMSLHGGVLSGIKDIPNERSLHQVPTPRIGGVGIFVGILAGWATATEALSWWIAIPLLFLFMLSLIDDIRGLSVRIRFAAHFIAGIAVAWGAGMFAVSVIWSVVAVLTIVWVINLYNFMDGSDGLAGGMALFGFSAYGIAALMGEDFTFAMMCFSVGAAALSFLFFNFAPAKIFMGDAGSIPLGFLAATVGISGWNKELWPIWFPVMIFAPFILDATVTLIKRAIRGETLWQAHREHYYQRMVQLGIGHRATALIEYAMMICGGICALWTLQSPNILLAVVIIWVLIYGIAMAYLDYRWKVSKGG